MTSGGRPPGTESAAPLRGVLLAFAGALLLLLLQSLPALGPLLEYRRTLLYAEPWRLLTGHLVHVNWSHAAANAAAWPILAVLFAALLPPRRQLLTLALSAVGVSLALAISFPQIAWYRGASGILHALYFAGALALLVQSARCGRRRAVLLSAALAVGGAVKVALEMPAGEVLPFADWLGAATVPQAHVAGAAIGAALGVLFGLSAAERPKLRGCE